MEDLLIIKIGGNIIDDPLLLKNFLEDVGRLEGRRMLVHGGGKLATNLSARLGLPTTMIEGRRVTDADTLQVVTMVYAGWINKSIVATLNAGGTRAFGLSGADGALIPAVKRSKGAVDFGFAGDIRKEEINTEILSLLLEQGYVPVIAPITSDAEGQLLNTNADSIASALAVSLASIYKVRLIFGFTERGVLHGREVIPQISRTAYEELKKKEIVRDGMIPKLDNAFLAIEKGVQEINIGHASEIKEMIHANAGTRIIA